jgi:hypothetical protein
MKLTIKCPSCGKSFAIELLKAQAEIDRLRADNKRLMDRLGKHDDSDMGWFFDALKGGKS